MAFNTQQYMQGLITSGVSAPDALKQARVEEQRQAEIAATGASPAAPVTPTAVPTNPVPAPVPATVPAPVVPTPAPVTPAPVAPVIPPAPATPIIPVPPAPAAPNVPITAANASQFQVNGSIQKQLNDMAIANPTMSTEDVVNSVKNAVGYNPADDNTYNLFYSYHKPSSGTPNIPSTVPTAVPTASASPTPTMQDILKTAGEAGVSLDDAIKILQSQSPTTDEDIKKIRDSLGITDLEKKFLSPPSVDAVKTFQDTLGKLGGGDIVSEVKKIDDQILALKNDSISSQQNISDNPFLTAEEGQFRLSKLADSLDLKAKALLEKRGQLTDLYGKFTSQAQDLTNQIVKQTEDANGLTKDQLAYLTTKAQEIVTTQNAQKNKDNLFNLSRYFQAKATAMKPVSTPAGTYQMIDGKWQKIAEAPAKIVGSAAVGYSKVDSNGKVTQVIAPKKSTSTGGGNVDISSYESTMQEFSNKNLTASNFATGGIKRLNIPTSKSSDAVKAALRKRYDEILASKKK